MRGRFGTCATSTWRSTSCRRIVPVWMHRGTTSTQRGGSAMARIRLLYVKSYLDRHGKVRHYFRRRGYPKVALPGVPGSPEFMEAYGLANSGEAKVAHPTSNRFVDRTLGAAVQSYFTASIAFGRLKPGSKRVYH